MCYGVFFLSSAVEIITEGSLVQASTAIPLRIIIKIRN